MESSLVLEFPKAREKTPQAPMERACEIYREYRGFIWTVICFHVKDTSLREDIFQDFFLSLVSKPMPDEIANIKSYLYRAIINDIKDSSRINHAYKARLRRYAACRRPAAVEDNPLNSMIKRENSDKMFDLLDAQLPEHMAKAIKLRYKKANDIQEIADNMNVSPRTVSNYISIGLSKMRRFFKTK